MISRDHKKNMMQYLVKRLESLDYCRASFEENINADKNGMLDSVTRGQLSPNNADLHKALFKIDYLIAPTFRNCMLIAVCTYLEESLRRLGNLIIDDYDSKVKQLKSGNWLKKQLRVYRSQIGADLNSIKKHIKKFEEIIFIRNAIVHSWGKVDAHRNPSKIKKIIDDNHWAEVSVDGLIYLDDQAYAYAM